MRLIRLQKGPNAGHIRTREVFGEYKNPPTIGKPFAMFCKPLTPGASLRFVETSRVVKIEQTDGGVIFETETGSVYQLDNKEEECLAN